LVENFKQNLKILNRILNIFKTRVLDAMLPYLTSFYGNPHSRTHAYGWESEKAVEVARKQVSGFFYLETFTLK